MTLFAGLQLRYMLGMRNRDHSYVVGTGRGPTRPADRAASCPLDFDVECNRSAAWGACASIVQRPRGQGARWRLRWC